MQKWSEIMRFIDYGKNGYKCFEKGGYFLFSEDGDHHLLFEYITKDLSGVKDQFDAYIRCRLDLETLEVRKGSSGEECLKQIEKTLKSAHPYYQYGFREACIDIIGTYFNRLLLYRCLGRRNFDPEIAKSKEWYLKTLEGLQEPFLRVGDIFPRDFYFKFEKQIDDYFYTAGASKDDFEWTIDMPYNESNLIPNVVLTQEAIRDFLYFVMDITVPDLSSLMTFQRAWLFKNIFRSQYNKLDLSAERHLSLVPNFPREYVGDYYDAIFSKLPHLKVKEIENNEVLEEQKATLRAAVNLAKKRKAEEEMIYGEYNVTSLEQLLNIELLSMLRDETMIRKCKNCGKYFVVTNRNTAYCDRIDDSGERCSAVGPSREFQKKMKEDEALKIYTRAYKTHFARVKKGTMEKDAFTEWCKEAKERLEQARAGKLDVPTFQEWLKK